jgi:hypothetical protein
MQNRVFAVAPVPHYKALAALIEHTTEQLFGRAINHLRAGPAR